MKGVRSPTPVVHCDYGSAITTITTENGPETLDFTEAQRIAAAWERLE